LTMHASLSPNKACAGQVGFVAIFEYYYGFESSLLPSRVGVPPTCQ
jgi:hypothetical protein